MNCEDSPERTAIIVEQKETVRTYTAFSKRPIPLHPCADPHYKGPVAPDGWPILVGRVTVQQEKEK